MIIYFSASTRNFINDIETYRRIINQIHTLGHTVANEWVETQWARHQGKISAWNISDVVYQAKGSIENSELLITEATSGSAFGVGYEVAYALKHKKPVLALIKEDLANDSYAFAIKDDLYTSRLYNDHNLEGLIEDFISENTVKTKDLRFNFVIDRKIHNYLRWKAFRSGRTKAEVVRDLLLEDMQKDG